MSISTIPPPPMASGKTTWLAGLTALALAGMAAMTAMAPSDPGAAAPLHPFVLPALDTSSEPEEVEVAAPARRPARIDEALRAKGFNECFTPDPVGLGPYAPWRELSYGRVAIPQEGGHTADGGYDVIVHFHGRDATRKTVAEVARGVVFAGIERGNGSGAYADTFSAPAIFALILDEIEAALQAHSANPKAHIRRLGLSAWSAGYGAINAILTHPPRPIDAVVLLDGLHAHWAIGHAHDGTAASVRDDGIRPIVDYARRAAAGEGLFVFTHSEVNPVRYPSTRLTAKLLVAKLDLEQQTFDSDETYGQVSRASRGGAFVWGYRGGGELGHCAQIPHVAEALEVVEGRWETPTMSRDVPPTPADAVHMTRVK